jgi:hypothetical protein
MDVHQPELPKQHSGRSRLTSHKLEERLRGSVLRFLAKELKVEVTGWRNVSVCMIQKVCKVRLDLLFLCGTKKASADGQDKK